MFFIQPLLLSTVKKTKQKKLTRNNSINWIKIEVLIFKLYKMGILGTLIVGAIAGWLGSTLYKGSGLGLFGNIIIGIIGAFIGYWFLGLIGVNLGAGFWGFVTTGAIGAIIILFVINLIVPKRS